MVKKSILAKVGDKINYKLIRDGYKTGKGNVVVTAEMDTKSTITADVPSTSYASNLDYEVDISGENPPIINIKNDITCPDDTIISKGKYLFYDIGQEYVVEDKDKIIEPIKNYTKVGNINVDSNGIASNFSTSNYIKLNTYLPSTFDIIIKYKHNSVADSQPGELIANPTTDNSLFIYYNGNPSKFRIGLYVNGVNSSFQTDNPVQYETGSWYWIRLIYDGNESKVYVIKDNNYTIKTLPVLSSWNHEQTKPVSNLWKDMYVTIGANLPYSKYNTGSIDLSNTYINEPGVTYASYIPGIKDFTLNDDGTELITKLFDYHYKEEIPYKLNLTKIGNVSVNSDGTVSNFSTSNYLRMLDKPSSSTTNFEMLFHFKCTSFSNSAILMGGGNISTNVLVYVFDNRFQIGNNNNWYKGTHDISLNKEYWGKVIFNNGTLSSYISEDGITYEQDYSGSLSSYVWNNNANIGYGSADNVAFQGIIWLEDCYVQYGNDEKTYFAEKSRLNDKASLYINPEKDNDLYYEKDELQLNVSKVGSCSIDKNGIASNFSNNSYVTFGKLNIGDNHWEMVFKVKYKEHSGFQCFCGPSDDKSRNLLITVSDEDKLSLYISTNGSDWSISGANSKTTLVNGTIYYIKALFNGTNYILSLSTDGINYNEEINEASTTPMYNGVSTNFQIGCAFSDESKYNWQGTIDLKESYIQIGTNEKKYFAEKVKKRYNIPSLYSEFIDNITIPAHALYDYIDGEWKLSSTSPFITQDVTVNADNAEITMKEIEE